MSSIKSKLGKLRSVFFNKLKSKTIKALLWSLFSNSFTKIISFVISIFLARLLAPEQFGIVGITLAIIAILSTISNLGFASALIQVKKIEEGMYSSVFWFNIICSLFLYAILFVFSGSIASYYNNEDLVLILRILGLILLFDALSIVQRTYLKRDLDFKSIATRNISANIAGGVLGVLSAFYGLGVFALVVQHLTRSLVGLVMFWYVSDWRPKLVFITRHIKQLSSFSMFKFIDSIVRTFFDKVSVFYIASAFSPKTLGFYSRSESFNSFLMQTITMPLINVLFPSFSRIQDSEEKFMHYAYISLRSIAFMISVFMGLFFIWGGDLILLLFGQKWGPSIPIFEILILGAYSRPIKITQASWLLGKGYSKKAFYFNLIGIAVVIFAILIGNIYGFESFLWSLVIGKLVAYFLQTFLVSKALNFNFFMLNKVTLIYFFVTYVSIYVIELNFIDETLINKIFISISFSAILLVIFAKNIKNLKKPIVND